MFLDFIFARYGWDYWTSLDQPEAILEELRQVYRAEADAERVRASRRSGRTAAASASPPVARTHDELMSLAAAQGFLQLEPPEN